MIVFSVICLFSVVLLFVAILYVANRSYLIVISGLRTENKELRDRLYQKHALPPSGIDLTEKYEARQEKQRAQDVERKEKGKQPLGPIERLTSRWTEDDRAKADRNIDATQFKSVN